ncbi:DUF3427 domain-containing protein [Microbacterium sp. gxy059]|uniref:DUF3427 domain-containing protein n=1 Tax=Microbacterium sp. gxy059 TaxID=2957199 RepID=UPI003D9845E5
MVLATHRDHFPALVASALREPESLSPRESDALKFMTREFLTAKRGHEITILRELLQHPLTRRDIADLLAARGWEDTDTIVTGLIRIFTMEFHTGQEVNQTYGSPIALRLDDGLRLASDVAESYGEGGGFTEAVDDLIATGSALIDARYDSARPLTPGVQYTRKDACKLLGWENNEQGVIYGYKLHQGTHTCPIFVTLHKSDDIAASTRYEDTLVDRSTMRWFTRPNKTRQTPEVRSIVAGDYALHVFVKKDDAEGSDFYYLGEATAKDPQQTTIINDHGQEQPIVMMTLDLSAPMEAGLYDYFHPVLTT